MTVPRYFLGIVAVGVLIAVSLSGCDGETTPSSGESSTTELVRAWQTDRLRLQHESDALRSVLDNQADDFLAMILIRAATAGALVMVILLLTRQQRSQQMLGRLFRLVTTSRPGDHQDPQQQPRKEGS
jgi:hypothetical protein